MVDGDTVFETSTVRLLVQDMVDPAVGAVAGNAKVANRTSLVARWQHIEYVMGFNLDRRLYDVLQCMPTVPGAIGAFRREVLVDVGGVSGATLAEDTDLTLAVGRAGWRVVYEENARAWTEAPATLRGLWRQRYRWCYETLQSVWKHRAAFWRHGEHAIGRRGLPYPVLFQIPDVLGFDLYPLQVWCRRDAFPAVYEAQRELAALAGPRATYQWIEVGRMEFCNGRPDLDPTPLTIRAETWLAIAGGARGIGYFPDHWQPPVAQAITQLNTEISALGPALLARALPATASAGPVRVGARRFNGATYVIAVNTSWRRVTATVGLAGLRGVARAFGENRALTVRSGGIRDGFGPLQAHVYVVGP